MGRQSTLSYYDTSSSSWITKASGAVYNAARRLTSIAETYETRNRDYDAASGWLKSQSTQYSSAAVSLSYNHLPTDRSKA